MALDLSAAFDTVDPSVLQDVLAGLGVGGKVARWMQSYLNNRSQKVVIGDVSSEPESLDCGVPQGSVLGPILFTIYTSSLGRLLRRHGVNYHFYADDTQLWLTFDPKDIKNAFSKMEECIKDVEKWMSFHHLKMNCDKTEYLLISSKQLARSEVLRSPPSINGQAMNTSQAIRNLGVMIDSNATMSAQVDAVCKACYMQLHNINRIKKHLDYQTIEKLIHCFISSRLDFCNSLFLGLPDSQLRRLQRIHNAAARILTNTRRFDHITPVLYELHWLPVEERITFKVLILVHKTLYGRAPAYLKDHIQPLVHQRDLRSGEASLINVPFTRSTFVQDRAFCVAGPTLWNSLPLYLREERNFDSFKANLKTFLFRKAYNDDGIF